MSDFASSFLPESRLPLYPIRVHRCDPLGESMVWCLANAYGGCMTAWNGKRSIYIAGETSAEKHVKGPLQWKGYVTSLLWSATDESWQPIALELTEQLELDFRPRYKRGQVWHISRANRGGRQKHPVRGQLLEEREARATPPEFDILPCLRNLYHVYDLRLTVPNPMAARVELPPVKGHAPVIPARPGDTRASNEDVANFRRKIQLQRGAPGGN